MNKINILNDFISNVKNNGVSRDDIKIIEDTLNENFITSIVNINSITTERSNLNISDVINVANAYIEDEKELLKPKYTTSQLILILSKMISKLDNYLYLMTNINEKYNSEIKNKILMDNASYFQTNSGEAYCYFNSDYPINDLFRKLTYDDKINLDNISWQKMDESTFIILTLFVWKDNNLKNHILDNEPIINMNPTVKEFISSLDGMHMILEGLSETIDILKMKQKSLYNGTYLTESNSNIFTNMENIINVEDNQAGIQAIRLLLNKIATY